MNEELKAAIAYFEDAIRESDEIIADCSQQLQEELDDQKRHFVVALNALRRAAERDVYRDKLKAALAENTRLAEKLAVKSEQLENLRTIFYEVTGSVPSKASQPVPLPEPPKEEK